MCENRIKPDFWKTFLIPGNLGLIVPVSAALDFIRKNATTFLFISLLAGCYPIFFNQLGQPVTYMWDEASYAHNALQMLKHGNPLVICAFDQPDLYNTKPPLAIWLMAGSINLFGFNEVAVRLPAAIFGCLSVCLVFIFCVRALRNKAAAWVSALVLLTSNAWAGWHISRSGDTDSILSFFMLAAALSFYHYLQTKHIRWWYMFIASLCLACLTKGITGLLILPGCFFFLLFGNRIKQLPALPHLIAGILLFVLLVPGYYVLRNNIQPGYLDAVFTNELGGRLHTQTFINPAGAPPFYAYLHAMFFENRFQLWIWFLPLALPGIFIKKEQQAGIFVLLTALGILTVISLSQTKLPWYDAPLYPLFAIIIGTGFTSYPIKKTMVMLISVAAIYPYYQINKRILHPVDEFNFPHALTYFRDKKQVTEPLYVYERHMRYPIQFYLSRDSIRGFNSHLVPPAEAAFMPNQLIITLTDERNNELEKEYLSEVEAQYYTCKLHRIIHKKHD